MMAAMESVSSGKVTVTAASREFNVPRKTIDDRVKERVTHGKKPGVSTVLGRRVSSEAPHLYGGVWLSTHKNNGQSLWMGNIKGSGQVN